MNFSSSFYRKIAYATAATVLLLCISALARPRSFSSNQKADDGGYIAKLRTKNNLSQASLSEVDPTSEIMKLGSLGLHGIAVNLLWNQANEYQEKKAFDKVSSTLDTLILLQPNFISVWEFQGHNLAYNISREFDDYEDRYFWVKEGLNFFMNGIAFNESIPELTYSTGRVWGQKIGMSDEWRYFRNYFKTDPDAKTYPNGVDPEINPNQLDNYLVSKEWFIKSNEREDVVPQHIMARPLFRSLPERAQLGYADALQRDVRFITASRFRDESANDQEAEERAYAARQSNFALARQEWAEGFREWTETYGQEEFQVAGAAKRIIFHLEADEDDVRKLAERQKDFDVSEQEIRGAIDRYQKMVNYNYWRTRSQAEADESTGTAEAHRLVYEGELKLRSGNPEEARDMLLRGMTRFAQLIEDYPDLRDEDLTVEEAVWCVLLWTKSLELLGEQVPATFPLKATWDKYQGLLPELQSRYNRGG